jgi:hypothetical protein
VDKNRSVTLHQQGTYAPEGQFRWMASPTIDRLGNIGIGYSFGGPAHFAGQRFAGRLANDPPGLLTLRETVLVEGEDAEQHVALGGLHADRYRPKRRLHDLGVGDYFKRGVQLLDQDRRVPTAGLSVIAVWPVLQRGATALSSYFSVIFVSSF